AGELGVAGSQAAVGVPSPGSSVVAMVDLNEADAALDHPAGGEAGLGEGLRVLLVHAVELPRLLVLILELEELRHGGLHAERQLVGLAARAQRRIVGVLGLGEAIEAPQQVELPRLVLAGLAPGRS